MRKKYEVSKTVAAGDDVNITVEFPDAATEGATVISRPDGKFFEITNIGNTVLGRAGEFPTYVIKMTSIIFNLAKEVDKVRMNVLVNDEIIVTHENLKTEDEHPTIKIRLTIETT